MYLFSSFLFAFFSLFSSQDYWKADKYTESNQLQHRWAENFFFSRYEFKGNEKVLDLGCGDGFLTKRISKNTSGKVWGMDSSPSMIRYAKTYYGTDELQFLYSSAENTQTYNKLKGMIDLVVSFHCLHWVKDHDVVLSGIHSVLKPGGKAFVRFSSDGHDPIQVLADELKSSEKWKGEFEGFIDPMQRYGVEEYKKKLKEHKFKVVNIQEHLDLDSFESLDAMATHIRGWLPHCKLLEKEKGGEFIEDLIGMYKSRYMKKDGKIELPDCYLEIEIQK